MLGRPSWGGGIEDEVCALRDIVGTDKTNYVGRQVVPVVVDTVVRTLSGCNHPRMERGEEEALKCPRRGKQLQVLASKFDRLLSEGMRGRRRCTRTQVKQASRQARLLKGRPRFRLLF